MIGDLRYNCLDTTPALPQVAALRAQVDDADSLLVLSPVNNASISAALKNALDQLSRPRDGSTLAAKPVTGLVLGYRSHGVEHHLDAILRAAGARVVPTRIPMLGLRTIDQRDIAEDPRVNGAVEQALAGLLQSSPATA